LNRNSPPQGLGGFVPDCGPRHKGNVAKQDRNMSFLDRNKSNFEVPIAGFINQPFYAQINAITRDEKVISKAIQIVDAVHPQKFGPHGTHFYSFARREHFLNLLLRFHDENKKLPDEIELLDLQSICNKKLYHQRDSDLISVDMHTGYFKTSIKRSDESKNKCLFWWYVVMVGLLLPISLAKLVARLDL